MLRPQESLTVGLDMSKKDKKGLGGQEGKEGKEGSENIENIKKGQGVKVFM